MGISISNAARRSYDRVLDLIAKDWTEREIAKTLHLALYDVQTVVRMAMQRGDKRLKIALGKIEQEPIVRERVTLAPLDADKARASLRPLIHSIRYAQDEEPAGNVTARLMGDPPPERSSLGRECLPHEYASGNGEGRWRDPCLGLGGGGMRFMNYGDRR